MAVLSGCPWRGVRLQTKDLWVHVHVHAFSPTWSAGRAWRLVTFFQAPPFLSIFVTYSPLFCLFNFSLPKFLNILFSFMSFAAEWKGRVAPKALLSRPKVKVRRAMMATLGMTLRLLPLLLLERWWRSRNLAMFKSMFDSQWPNFHSCQSRSNAWPRSYICPTQQGMFNTDIQTMWYYPNEKECFNWYRIQISSRERFFQRYPDTRNWIKIPWKSSGGMQR